MRKTALFLAVLLSGAIALAQEETPNPVANEPTAAATGGVIFNTTCVSCHGVAGRGGSGPALTGPLRHGNRDGDIFRVISGGIDGTEMPAFPGLSEENSWRVALYVAGLAAPAAPIVSADAQAGEALFFGRGGCTACHEIDGKGLDLASDLSAVGLKPGAAIRDGMVHRDIGMRFVSVTTAQGTRLTGVVRAEDLGTMVLKQRDGTLTVLAKSGLRNVSNISNPLLPPALSARETGDIVAYLAGHKARNLAETAKRTPIPVLPYSGIASPETRDWSSHRGALDGSNFSALSQIGAGNAAGLQARWSANLGDGAGAATPIVANGVIYVSGRDGEVFAFDARSGLALWRFNRQPVTNNPAGGNGNHGVAVLEGRVFVATSDNKLIALDAHNGRQLWEKQTASTLDGYVMNGAPLALRTRVIVGVGGSGAKARGWLDAYDPATGARLWRFESLTAPLASGAMTANIGAYEAQNVTLYWSTTRSSDDSPHGDAILALNANSAAISWERKLKAGAGGDGLVLAEQSDKGRRRALLLHLGRDGQFTVLDRGNGSIVLQKSLRDGRIEQPSLSFDRASGTAFAGLGDAVAALDSRNGRVLWRTPTVTPTSGVLATRGNVVFAGLADGQMVALDSARGKLLWSFRAAGPIAAAPVTYSAGGKQFVAIVAGNMLYAFALPGT